MNCLGKPITLLVLCLLLFIPIVITQDQDLCQIYDDTFECEKSSSRCSSWIGDDTEPVCGFNLFNTTLELFKEGDKVIGEQFEKFGTKTEAVLLIGKTGTGKSTLTYFMAGNDSAMISHSDGYRGVRITDCNKKIGGSIIVPQTTFTELVIDPKTCTAFFDYIGFYDTQEACVEIANAYFRLTVSRKIPKAKILIVVDYAAVNGQVKGSIKETLESVINFIPNIESYAGGIGLVATKVDIPRSDDTVVGGFIQKFLGQINLELNQSMTGDKLRKATFIIDELLISGKVGSFRVPQDCGPLSDMPYMQSNKANLTKVIDSLSYIQTKPNDFSTTLSGNARNELPTLAANLMNSITDSFVIIADVAKRSITLDCADQGNCTRILTTISALFGDAAFISGYTKFDTWLHLSLNAIVMNTVNVYSGIIDIIIDPKISAALDTNSKYIDFLGTIHNITVELPSIYKPLQDVTKHVARSISALSSDMSSGNQILYNKLARMYIELTFLGPMGAT